MPKVSREQLLFWLYEAAELEHTLMCTYLYAAWTLKDRDDPGVDEAHHELLAGWKRAILRIAIEEMSHLVSVWNITVALGGAPRIGRFNFPLPAGALPASMVVRLAPFTRETLQHFIFLERPLLSAESDGEGFLPLQFGSRGNEAAQLTPMPDNYATVGEFYASLQRTIGEFVAERGESLAFSGDRGLQISGSEFGLPKARPVICAKTAIEAFDAIVAEGEGSLADSHESHFHRFMAVREALDELQRREPNFSPAHPAATNPVLRRPPEPEGRIWIEDPRAVATIDLANSAYGLMLRAIAYAYAVPASDPRKGVMLQLSMGLMHAMSPLAEATARLPAGPSHPNCNAGISFTAPREGAALPPGLAADLLIAERLHDFAERASALSDLSPRHQAAAAQFAKLLQQFEAAIPAVANRTPPAVTAVATASASAPPTSKEVVADQTVRVEVVPGRDVEVHYRGVRCIHSRHCVTGAPTVFLANVEGPWIHPDTVSADRVVEVAHACPSGAIRYRRLDGKPDEAAPPVNLAWVREAGPLALHGDLLIDGESAGMRATLCRCGASRHKPYCDGSHKEAGFAASGEPPTQGTTMLAKRDGPLRVDPQTNGPLQLQGNLEIVSGTGRIVARVTAARLCRCGGSSSKPFCDGTHERIGFRSN